MHNFKIIYSYLKPYWKRILAGIICLLIVDAAQLIIPKIIQHVIDTMHKPGFTMSVVFQFALLIFVLALIMAGLRFLWRVLLIKNSFKIERKFRNDYYEHLQKLSQKFYQQHNTGDLMAYATNDLRAVRMLFGIGFVMAFDVIIMMIPALILMGSIDFRLTLYVVIPLPIVTFIMVFFGRKIHRRFSKVQEIFEKLSGRVQEIISGIRLVKSFNREEQFSERVNSQSRNLVNQRIDVVKIWGLFFPLMFMIIGISQLLMLYFGGKLTILSDITIGELVAFNSYLQLLSWPVIGIGWIANLYQRGTASLNRIRKIMAEEPDIYDDEELVDHSITELHGKLEVKNLSFSYEDSETEILKDISFSINKGETLAIVGQTGAGKSTIIKILTRMVNPPRNTIFYDDNEIYKIPLDTLRNGIAVVTQDIFLFASTVKENIRVGNKKASLQKIEEITQMSQFHKDILDMEDQFDSVIGERGVSLSGGQKQRLAIARALIKNASFLILDDALSSVDTETEELILKELKEYQKNRANIIIAHRISTMKHADKIIVLKDGGVAERGTHKQLVRMNGIYTDIYNKQKLKEEYEL
ncbi:MAG: ABC transporter ATP-binding protein [Candidatus Cloacimonetes bacterium]|nr:ABC transporter ATP-binding protein [Candidatus Cloacimonadota bacterium]